MMCPIAEEGWKETGLFEWGKGSAEGASLVAGFACAAGPLG